ncbi:hypothetical protein IJG29_00745 [Candidatus Saccharibacteria bacterium]|nr:hypothetical protein [Candidatus Saccharibacteria bacterium]
MGYLEEMLLRNGLIYRAPDGSSSYIEGSLLTNTLVVRNSEGYVTHRIERSWNGVDVIVRNVATGCVEQTLQMVNRW